MKTNLALIVTFYCQMAWSQPEVDSLKLKVINSGHDTVKVAALYDLGYHFLRVNYDSALFYLNKARPYLDNEGIDELKPDIHNLLQYTYRRKGMYDSALASLKIIEQHNIATGQEYNLGLCYYNMGWVYKFQNRFEKAIEHYLKALQIFESMDKFSLMANAEISIGNIYADEDLYDQAFKNYQRALKYAENSGDSLRISNALSSIGNVYFHNQNYIKALEYYQRNLNVKKQLSDPSATARAISNVAKVNMALKEYEKAMSQYNRALAIFDKLGNRLEKARVLNALGQTQLELKEYRQAIGHANEASQILLAIKAPLDLSESLWIMALGNEKLENFGKALTLHKQYTHLRDSLFTVEKTEQIARLEEQYEAEKKEKEIAFLNQENQVKAATIRQREWQNYLFIAGMSFIGIITLLLYNQYRIKKKALLQKDTLLKEIHHRVKNNLQIIESLLNLQSEWKGDKTPDELLRLSQDRIHAISAIHDKLYQSKDLKSIDFKTYTDDLIHYFRETYCTKDLSIHSKIEEVELDLDLLIPCGLILNELITNSIKYAFNGGQKGIIDVLGYSEESNKYCLEVKDNGIGLHDGFDLMASSSLGLKLVKSLSQQIDGVFEVIKGEGANFKITFTA